MVDLGFLLITFFVFTTTATQPKALQLFMPAETDTDQTPLRESTVLTIIPISNDKVFYYHGQLSDAEQNGLYGVTNFSVTEGIGVVIRQKQKALEDHANFKSSDLILVIRPASEANYKNIVDALDEVLINQVTHYSFVDLTQEEIKFMEAHQIK